MSTSELTVVTVDGNPLIFKGDVEEVSFEINVVSSESVWILLSER